MNRRRFLELLSQAAVGSAVVYSFPKVIVPKNIVIPQTWYNTDPNIITFNKLMESYNRACIGNSEPKLILVNKNAYAHIMEMIEPQYRFTGKSGSGLAYRGSEIRINEYLNPGEIVTI